MSAAVVAAATVAAAAVAAAAVATTATAGENAGRSAQRQHAGHQSDHRGSKTCGHSSPPSSATADRRVSNLPARLSGSRLCLLRPA
jgi:hypothetical protein